MGKSKARGKQAGDGPSTRDDADARDRGAGRPLFSITLRDVIAAIIGGLIVLLLVLAVARQGMKNPSHPQPATATAAPVSPPPAAEPLGFRTFAQRSPLPDFSLSSAQGAPFTRASIAGEVTVMHFWKTGCSLCVPELERMNEALDRVGYDKVKVVLGCVEPDFRTDLMTLSTYPKLLAAAAHDPGGRTAARFGSTGLPDTYFVDRNGNVAAKCVSACNWGEMDAVIQALLSEPGPARAARPSAAPAPAPSAAPAPAPAPEPVLPSEPLPSGQ